MLNLIIPSRTSEGLKILCLGAHGDDLEIGCGGTILRLLTEYPAAAVHWIVFSAAGIRKEEANKSASLFLEKTGNSSILIENFRDGFFPYTGIEIKDYFEELKTKFSPDLIFTHYSQDAHQDHRLINELTWNTWRDHLILEYEVPKYDGDFGRPNFFVSLKVDTVNRKIQFLEECFKSQSSRHWFDPEIFRGLMRLRGMESRAPEGFAEAFYCRKIAI